MKHFIQNSIHNFKHIKKRYFQHLFPISNNFISNCAYSSTSAAGSNDITNAASIINKASNILVMTGAGLSTPSGIADFSAMAKLENDPMGKHLSNNPISLKMNHWLPLRFLILAQDLYPGIHYKPNIGHYFMHLLHMKDKLLKIYTQNIDGLERLAGVPEDKLVESHGTLLTATCTLCGEKHEAKKVKEKVVAGKVPIFCEMNGCKGKVKPDIVFFGENLPKNFFDHEVDVHFTDVLLIVGTSLEVYPFASIADAVNRNIPRILINREVVGSLGERPNDLMLTGDLISTIKELAQSLDWTNDLNSMIPKT